MLSFLEQAAANEAQVDFCLWPYPALKPCAGKLRSISLLAESFAGLAAGPRALEMMLAIRQELGDLRTVWGVKQTGADLSWELYFYDYGRTNRERSLRRVVDCIRPWVSCAVELSDHCPYFMFSLDFSRDLLEKGGELHEVQMYLGNIGSTVSSGICYAVTRQQTLLKNFYFFFDARSALSEIAGKVCTSAFIQAADFDVNRVLWPELRDCELIVVANKADRDGLYFSRIKAAQLLWFLKRMGYPERQTRFLESNMDRFDHMLYDVGIDYRIEAGQLKILKSAYYGVF